MENREMNGLRVAITGGTGFIGSRLALRLLVQGVSVRVVGLVNNDAERSNLNAIENAGADVVIASVEDRERMLTALHDTDVVFHLAAAQHEANVPDQHFWDVNVAGTENVLEAGVESGVKRFVHGSTIGVYGSGSEGRIDENTPLRPDNIYGITKAEGEKRVRSFQDRLATVIIRIPETYGAGDRRLLKLFRAIKNNVFFMIGSGENIHHLIYIDDLLDGLLLSATASQATGQTFVLAGKEAVTTNEMVATIAKAVGGKVRFRAPLLPFLIIATLMETVMRPLGIQPPLHRRRMDFFRKSFVFSPGHAESTLGFRPCYSFSQGITETAKWYTEQGYLQ